MVVTFHLLWVVLPLLAIILGYTGYWAWILMFSSSDFVFCNPVKSKCIIIHGMQMGNCVIMSLYLSGTWHTLDDTIIYN